MKRILFSVYCCLGLVSFCAAQNLPERIVEITKSNVNIRKEASATGAVVEKAPLGKQYELVSEKGTWFEIKDPQTGVTAFVANSVAVAKKPVAISDFLKFSYVNSKTTKEYEQSYRYGISLDEKNKEVVDVLYEEQYVDIQGRARADQAFYKGKIKGWYIVLDTQIDFDETESPLDPPMILYRSVVKEGSYINGAFYKATEASLL